MSARHKHHRRHAPDLPDAIRRGDGRPVARQFASLPWRRLADGSVQVLLITSRETRRWVIPKGWPMANLTPAEAAAREAYEEAGLVGDPSPAAIGTYPYAKRLRDGSLQAVEVTVFPLEVFVEQLAFPERGQREKLWVSPEAAAERVDEPELKVLIRAFRPPPGRTAQ